MIWPSSTIGDLCERTSQRDPSLRPDEQFTYVDISSVDKDAKTIVRPTSLLGSEAPSRARKEVGAGDILVSTVRPNLNAVAVVPEELDGQIASTGFCVLRPKSNVAVTRYCFYWTQTDAFVDYLLSRARGASYPAVTDGVVLSCPLPLPPPSEQRRIVEILDQADTLRRKRAQADALANRVLPAIFNNMFGDPAPNPKGWPCVPVSHFVNSMQGGKSVGAESEDVPSSRFRVLKVSAVTSTRYKPDECKPLPSEFEPPAHHFVRSGDLLFSRANTTELVGASAYVFHTPSDRVLPDKLWRFVWKEPRCVEPLFVWFLLRHSSVRLQLSKVATGTSGSMKNISMEKLLALRLPLPPLTLQQRFASLVRTMRVPDEQRAASRNGLETLWGTLMQHAFDGALTAKWRQAHRKELLAEMEQQARLLGGSRMQPA